MKTIFALLLAACATAFAASDWREQGILYLDHSAHAALHPVPVRAVTMGKGFWYERRRVNVERSIPTMLDLLEEHGVLDNFRRLGEHKQVPLRGPVYTDSDIYKWMEAVAFVLQSGPNPELQAKLDADIGVVLAAQEPSGYLNTHWSAENAPKRFTEMYRSHELYCLGHMLQAGIAYYRATGNRKLLDGGIRFADYLVRDFGPDKRPLLTGHPELEMALVELYRTTGERKYLDLAGYLLSGVETERLHLKPSQTDYMFSGVPFTSRTALIGHAVRAMYASSGAADYYAETGDPAYWKTLGLLWEDLTRRKMYITGGVGSRSQGEAFGAAYELPNAQAYTESCAAIGNMMWNFRMLSVTAESKYADVIERALYNGINSGMSLDGSLYCYRNPLSSDGEKIRNPWYDTTCCPPNIERILASLPGYFYATNKDGLWVHLYHNSVLNWKLEDGTALRVTQRTDYPWSGGVTLEVAPAEAREFALHVRIPAWAGGATATANGIALQGVKAGQFFSIRRTWKPGDTVTLHFDAAPRLVVSNPLVPENGGKVAVERGPLVYCLEQLDQQGDIGDLAFASPAARFAERRPADLLGGIVELSHAGVKYSHPLAGEPLYVPLSTAPERPTAPAELRFIPYYAWANREPSPMEVWIPLR